MKRSGPLRRGKPLRRGGPLSRSAPKPSRGPSRSPSTGRNGPTRARGGVTPETATYVLNRDGSCRAWAMGFATDVRCEGRPHIHHRRLRSQGGPHTADNLLVICELHHRLAHDVRRAEAERCDIIVRAR